MKRLSFIMLTFSLMLLGCGNKSNEAATVVEEAEEQAVEAVTEKVDTLVSDGIAETFADTEEEIAADGGFVAYEGSKNYYIVETSAGFTVLRALSGFLRETDFIRGDLNRFGMGTVTRMKGGFTVEVDVQQCMLTERMAVEWLGDRKLLKPRDQKTYDGEEEQLP